MNQELNIQQEIFSRLDALAAKLNVTVEHLWTIFTHQAYYSGIAEMSVCLIVVALSLCVFWFSWKHPKFIVHDYKEDRPTGWLFVSLFSCLTFVASAITLCTTTSINITRIFNPEYYAWLEIRQLFK